MSNNNSSPKKKAAAKKPVAKKAAPKQAADGAKKTPAKRGRPPKKKIEQAPVKEGPTGSFTDSFLTAEGANGPAGPFTPLYSAAKGFNMDAKDGDGDGLVQDGTVHQRPLEEIEEVVSAVESIFEELKDGASEIVETVKETIDNVIRASDVIKPSLRKRMLAWFKRK